MRILSHFSIAIALATAGTMAVSVVPQAASAQNQKPRKVKLSKAFKKAAGPLEKRVKAGDPSVKAEVEQLLQQPWSGDDLDIAGQYAINLGAALKDKPLQELGINARLKSGVLSATNRAKLLRFSGIYAQGRGDNVVAESQLKAAIAAGFPGPGAHLDLANLYSKAKRHGESLSMLAQAIQMQNSTADKAPEDWYRAARDRALATKDDGLYFKWSTNWATAYPSAAAWNDAILAYKYSRNLSSLENLEVLRLMRASGGMTQYDNYKEFAEEGEKIGGWAEIASVLEQGQANGVVESGSPLLIENLARAKREIPNDRATLPTDPNKTGGSGSANSIMNFADLWIGYKNYSKAAEFYKVATAKASDPVEVNRGKMGTGIALALSGDQAGAATAFGSVTGPRAELAKLWKILLSQQSVPAPTETSTAG